jgi:hypothetical protein
MTTTFSPCDQVGCHFSLICLFVRSEYWTNDMLVTCCQQCGRVALVCRSHINNHAGSNPVALLPNEMAVKCSRSRVSMQGVCSNCRKKPFTR